LDFVVSAIAVRPVLDRAAELGVGRAVLQCVRATREAVGANTNLGIVLLLAPLCAVRDEVPLEQGVRAVLDSLSREDAQLTYEAIRLAKPGGLGRAAAQDVRREPTVSLVEAMRLAADRDAVARQYVNGFADVFAVADELATDELPLDELIVRAHLRRMAAEPDSLIARKAGRDEAVESRRRAAAVLDAGWPAGEAARGAFARLDRWLREAGGRRNPGTSADLIAAGLYVALRAGRLTPPFRWASPVGAEDAAGGRSSC
jgi:triphosphoribosyl-dephospho-CoA synthase